MRESVADDVIIITRFFYPAVSIDSTSSLQMAEELQKRLGRAKVVLVTSDNLYKSNQAKVGFQQNFETHYVHSYYRGNHKALKFLFGLFEGYLLVKKAKELKIRNIITLTNPPLINVWCSLFFNNRTWFYWAFDLYPEALVSSKLLKTTNIIVKVSNWILMKRVPDYLIALGKQQAKYLEVKFQKTIKSVILPCGIQPVYPVVKQPSWKIDEEQIYLGYVGNIGMAHSITFLERIIGAVKNIGSLQLILSIYGEHADYIKSLVSPSTSNIVFIDSIPRDELQFIDIHIVSLQPEWTHVSVPSKAVSAICAGGALLFYGDEQSDTWQMFDKVSWRISNFEEIPDFMNTIRRNEVQEKRCIANEIAIRLLKDEDDSFEIISDLVKEK